MDQAEQLRNIIKQNNQARFTTARVLTVTSGKGGVGKSNLSVNLAVQLARQGNRVIIFDADFGLANVEVMFGTLPRYNLSDLIYRGKKIKDIITKGPLDIGFISGGSGITGLNNLSKDQISFLVRSLGELDNLADFIIIDTGAGVSDSVLDFVLASPEILLVTTSDPSSVTDSYSLLKALHRNPGFKREDASIKVVANKVANPSEGYLVYEKLNSVVSQFLKGNVSYLGMIPQDVALERAIRQQNPVSLVNSEAKSSKAYEFLAKSLTSKEMNEQHDKRGISHFITDFLQRRKI
jgi:flagellar biosynthesis protein FlhG